MIRTTVFCILAVLALALSSAAGVTSSPQVAPAVQSSSPQVAPVVQSSSPQVAPPAVQSSSPQVAPVVQSSSPQVAPPAVQSSSPQVAPVVQSSSPQVAPAVQSSSPQVAPVVQSSSPQVAPPAVQSSSPQVAPVVQSSSPQVAPAVQSSSPQVAPSPSAVFSSNVIFSTEVIPSGTAQPSSMIASASGIVQSSFVSKSALPSQSATPALSPAMMSSNQVVNSSLVPSPSTPAVAFITPSPTVVMASESIQINDTTRHEPCLSATLEVDFMIYYNVSTKPNGTEGENTTIPLNGYDKTISVSGKCNYSDGYAYFMIKWNEQGHVSGPQHIFRMDFRLDAKTDKWNVPNITAVFQTDDTYAFPNGAVEPKITASVNGSSMFGSRKNGTNYVCDAQRKLVMSHNVTAMFKNVILQPFKANSKVEHNGYECSADNNDDDDDDDDNTVPIAVGAALGGLVLIVLVAYIIGRRRSNRGYEQV